MMREETWSSGGMMIGESLGTGRKTVRVPATLPATNLTDLVVNPDLTAWSVTALRTLNNILAFNMFLFCKNVTEVRSRGTAEASSCNGSVL
jgi:hypothetical protein